MEEKYYPTIGLEIHAELKTQTKMFCGCKNNPDEKRPNVNICPVCMAHPGALPIINKKAIENVIKVGLAVDGKIADFSEFDRKNYFYPDIPKGYQISQYKYPIVSGGHLAGMDITRVHLEEDTGTNKHPEGKSTSCGAGDLGGYSLVDFNRAGIPLMELVTEPHTFDSTEETAKTATKFAKELQLILWYLDVGEVNMEKGEMRVEVNISVSKDKDALGTKVEIKNLNSFRNVERAIRNELDRMIGLFEEGREKEIVQETRGWDESKQKTFSQRKKEGSADYRYFPDPDLPKLKLHEAFDLAQMKKNLPELPEAKRKRYEKDFGIKAEDIEVFINDVDLSIWFEEVAKILNNTELVKLASNYITSDYIGIKKTNPEVKLAKPDHFAELMVMTKNGYISSRVAKDIFGRILINDESPKRVAEENNLLQISDEKILKPIIQKVVDSNPKIVDDYKSGQQSSIMSLVGQIIKETKGSANPVVTKQILEELLK